MASGASVQNASQSTGLKSQIFWGDSPRQPSKELPYSSCPPDTLCPTKLITLAMPLSPLLTYNVVIIIIDNVLIIIPTSKAFVRIVCKGTAGPQMRDSHLV